MLYCYEMFNSRVRIKESMNRNQRLAEKKAIMSSNCFICSESFPRAELSAHERQCLQNIQKTEVSYTRQDTGGSSTDRIPASPSSIDASSNHSSGSAGSSEERKMHRCYICGQDVAMYLKSIHEKSCKRSWENGILNNNSTNSRVRSNSRSDKSPDVKSTLAASKLSKSSSYLSRSVSQLNSKSSTPTKSPSKASDHKSSWDRQKSQSSTNLLQRSSSKSSLYGGSQDNLHSEVKRKPSTPHYVECHNCGKQYSTHSIDIHQKQCMKTRKIQEQAGLVDQYKKKSKSLADLTLNNHSPSKSPRPTSFYNRPPSRTESSRSNSSSTPTTPAKSMQNLSRSQGYRATKTPEKPKLTPKKYFDTPKRSVETPKKSLDLSKKSFNGHNGPTPSKKTQTTQSKSETNGEKPITPGFQECMYCTQLYGSRSLPIHEKQCLKKMELAREQEEKNKSKRKQSSRKSHDFDIMSFGRNKEFDADAPSTPVKTNSILTPSKLFGVASPLTNGTNGHHSDSDNNDAIKCVHCQCYFEADVFTAHELVCDASSSAQQKENTPTSPQRLRALSKSAVDIRKRSDSSDSNDVTLVTCVDCNRRFLSEDIARHQMHCRIAIL